jgi:RNA polymerase sigma-70 factor (ECF subfamily)
MNNSNIEEAIKRVQAGYVEDYRTVLVAFHQRLRSGIAALCPPGVEADEIAHLAFLHAYRHIHEYQPGTNFPAWLGAIARNLLRTECTRRRRLAQNKQNYLEHLIIERLHPALCGEPSTGELLAGFLAECLTLLKTEAQSILNMRYREGLQVKVIAARLGRSVTAVSVQLFEIRKLLRECVARKRGHAATNR